MCTYKEHNHFSSLFWQHKLVSGALIESAKQTSIIHAAMTKKKESSFQESFEENLLCKYRVMLATNAKTRRRKSRYQSQALLPATIVVPRKPFVMFNDYDDGP